MFLMLLFLGSMSPRVLTGGKWHELRVLLHHISLVELDLLGEHLKNLFLT